MDDQWYTDSNSCSIPTERRGTEFDSPSDSASPRQFASQIREMLGEEGDLDPRFFEESWSSGVPVQLGVFRGGHDRDSISPEESSTFAERDSLGDLLVSLSSPRPDDFSPPAHSARPMDFYGAIGLRDPLEVSPSRVVNYVSASKPTHSWSAPGVTMMCGGMTYQQACEVLCVSEDSTVDQIKKGYRRMVSEWHPDRMEQSGEILRARATEQMAAINAAYHYLQSNSSAANSRGSAANLGTTK